jgi:hypothetical protein
MGSAAVTTTLGGLMAIGRVALAEPLMGTLAPSRMNDDGESFGRGGDSLWLLGERVGYRPERLKPCGVHTPSQSKVTKRWQRAMTQKNDQKSADTNQ